MRRTKNGKAVGLNDIPVWRCLQEDIGLFNTILESERNVGVSVFKSKCHVSIDEPCHEDMGKNC